jgi:hypothetical protein
MDGAFGFMVEERGMNPGSMTVAPDLARPSDINTAAELRQQQQGLGCPLDGNVTLLQLQGHCDFQHLDLGSLMDVVVLGFTRLGGGRPRRPLSSAALESSSGPGAGDGTGILERWTRHAGVMAMRAATSWQCGLGTPHRRPRQVHVGQPEFGPMHYDIVRLLATH